MVLHLKESKINLHEDLLRQKKRQGLACGRRASEKASGGPEIGIHSAAAAKEARGLRSPLSPQLFFGGHLERSEPAAPSCARLTRQLNQSPRWSESWNRREWRGKKERRRQLEAKKKKGKLTSPRMAIKASC